MPDFDLLIELAKYYKVEVSEILDGERKGGRTDGSAEELMLKIADYSNIERKVFSRRMCAMFVMALASMAFFAAMDVAELAETEPYGTIVGIARGFVAGTFLYASRYISKMETVKMRLAKGSRKLKQYERTKPRAIPAAFPYPYFSATARSACSHSFSRRRA